ncbi:hypothetical protein [Polaribacter sp.]|uniref:hypothetical protein n=1 Tax=Polaribacter sp. TaxID=1920175 RepID=UPI0040471178
MIGFSQKSAIVSGYVKDTQNNPLNGASVIALKPNSDDILVYSSTNVEGFFSLNISTDSDSLVIKTSYLGYKHQIKNILNTSVNLVFNLSESLEELKEIVIKNSIIEKMGDTLSFAVSRFKSEKDRVIADVLKRMPGIEVQSDGKILYQGKQIEKYYIEGLDLLEGKYNLANNNLPIDEVSKVQILENHQPIKVLDSVIFSENTSLNIKLKKGSVFVVPSSLGVGYKPKLYELSSTPMNFNKKNQFIGNFKTNNTGHNLAKEIKVLTFEEFMDQKQLNNMDLLQISPLAVPLTSEKKWLDNQIYFSSINFLNKLANNYEIKISASYIHDNHRLNGNTKTLFYAGNIPIEIDEIKENNLSINDLKSKITIENNNKNHYFINSFELNTDWNVDVGIINNNSITQNLTKPNKQFNNNLKWIFPFNKILINVNSKIFYNTQTENLKISPGFFDDLLTNGNNYDMMKQRLFQNHYFINNSIGFSKIFKKITISPKVGFEFQGQFLDSKIFINQENNFLQNEEFRNDLKYKNTTFFASTLLQFQKNSFKFNFLIPFRIVTINSFNKSSLIERNLSKTVFEPNLSVSREFGAFWRFGASSSFENRFGNINELYDGLIVKDYRNIFSYSSIINEKKIQNHRFSMTYQNYLKGLFITANYSKRNQISNIIFDYKYNSNGSLELKAIEESNKSNDDNYGIRSSKFFSKINTTVNFSSIFSNQKRFRIINNDLFLFKNNQYLFKLEIDYELSSWLSLFTTKSIIISEAISNSQNNQKQQRDTNVFELNLYPKKHMQFKISYEAIIFKNNKSQKNDFLDLSFNYKFPKNKSSLSIQWNNILNRNSFVNNFISDNYQIQTNFLMRPSQIMVNYSFSF